MSRVVTCPVDRWPGTVTLITPAPYPVVREWRKCVRAASAYLISNRTDGGDDNTPEYERSYSYEPFELNALYIPGFMAFVEKWELGGDFPKTVTADTFPAQPSESADKLVSWLIKEISATFQESESVPNA